MSLLRKLVHGVCPSQPQHGRIGSIDLILWLAQLTGIPLLGLKPETKPLQVLLLCYGAVLSTLISILYMCFEFYDLYLHGQTLEAFTQNFCLLLTHIAGTAKLINCLKHLGMLQSIVRKLGLVTKRYVLTTKQRQVFHSGEFETKTLLLVYVLLVTFTAFLGMGFLFRNPSDVAGKIFPYRVQLPLWLPLPLQLAYSGIAVWIFALQIVACDYLNITFINQLRYQLMVLNLSFEQLILDDTDVPQQQQLLEYNRRLHEIVEHHCSLRVISNEIERLFRMPVLMQFLTSIIIMALSGFQAITEIGGKNNLLLIYFYCGCITCELGLYCWFGNEVFEQSKTVPASVFSLASWYRLDGRFRNSLVIFLLNAQKPFLFTAGGFVGLTLPSFASILGKSYSFVAVLRQFYE